MYKRQLLESNGWSVREIRGLQPTPKGMEEALARGAGVVAGVLLETNDHLYAVRRPAIAPGTMFALGRFQAFLTTPELLFALNRGHVVRVFSWQEYIREPIFERVFGRLQGLRAEMPDDPHLKRLMQAIHGGLAQKRPADPPQEISDEDALYLTDAAWGVIRSGGAYEDRFGHDGNPGSR